MKKKKCPFCRTSFSPDSRVGELQKACCTPACQKARKAVNNRSFRKANPGYFCRDFARLKE